MATQIRVAQLTGSFPSSSRSAATTVSAAVGGSGNNGDLSDALDHIASAVKRIHGASIFAGAAAGIAKIIFFIFLVLLVISLVSGALRGKSPR